MAEGSLVPGGSQGKSRWAVRAQRSYEVVKGALWLVLLYSASQWLIVRSPAPEPSTLVNSTVLVLCSLAVLGFAVFLAAVLSNYIKVKKSSRKTAEDTIANKLPWSIFSVPTTLSLILLIFSASIWIFSRAKIEDLGKEAAAAALSSASTFALFVVASLISIMALFGWHNLSSHIDSRVERISKESKDELMGRFFTMTGHTMGELNLTEGFEAKDQDRMRTAVEFCRMGYEQLKDRSPGARLMALNNYTFYRALEKNPLYASRLLENARELREVGFEYRVPSLLLTYCRVVVCYAERNSPERDSAQGLLANLIKEMPLEYQERKEALHCQSLFSDPNLPYKQVPASQLGR